VLRSLQPPASAWSRRADKMQVLASRARGGVVSAGTPWLVQPPHLSRNVERLAEDCGLRLDCRAGDVGGGDGGVGGQRCLGPAAEESSSEGADACVEQRVRVEELHSGG